MAGIIFSSYQKIYSMRLFLFILAIVLLIVWVLGTFYYYWGAPKHLLLMLAAVAGMQGLMICPKSAIAGRQTGT